VLGQGSVRDETVSPGGLVVCGVGVVVAGGCVRWGGWGCVGVGVGHGSWGVS